MAKIFLTGASGYIGGEVLHQLIKSGHGYQIRALVRDANKAKAVGALSGQVEVVIGDLDDAATIVHEAAAADVVLHLAATGHAKSATAIKQGLSQDTSKTKHWIQISGASALGADEIADHSRVPGSSSDLVFDDVQGVGQIRALIQRHQSRAVDNLVLSAAREAPGFKTALVFGPIIYGEGSGPVNRRSVQIPSLARATLQRKRGVQVGAGLSRWSNVHIGDLVRIIVQLVECASSRPSDEEVWGENGLYLAGVGELSFGEISKHLAAAAHQVGLVESEKIDELEGSEADEVLPHGNILFGTNARGKAGRAQKVLGWAPSGSRLEDEIPRAVLSEAKDLQKLG